MKYIKKIDFLSRSANFTFNEKGDTTYKTMIGGIISFITIFGSFGLCIYFLLKFFDRNKVTVVHSTQTDIYINNTISHKMPILLRLSDTNSNTFDNPNKIYNITLKVWHGGSNDSIFLPQTYEDVKMEKCDINKHFNGKFKNVINDLDNIDTYYCPIQRYYNQTLYGIYGSIYPFSYYSFTIRFCKNSTENNSCYPLDYSINLLQESYLDVIIIDYTLDSLNQENTGKMTFHRERFMISSTMFKRIWYYLENIIFLTDEGYIFQNNKINRFHRYNSVRFDVDSRDTKNVYYFGTLTILNTSQSSIYYKSYSKIQDYIAVMGGIIKAFTILGTFLNYFNALNSYYFKVITDFMIDKNNDKIYKKYWNTSNISLINLRNQLSGFQNCKNDLIKQNQMLINKAKTVCKNNDFVKRRISSSLFPITFSSKKIKYKKEIFLLIEGINKRLNIITVLKKLETINLVYERSNIKDLSKLNQSKSQSKINNYLIKDNSSSEKREIFNNS